MSNLSPAQMTVAKLELPFPPSQLSPNSRRHYMVKAYHVRKYREACGWEAKAQGIARLSPPVEATVTFVVPDRRKRDLDNLLAMLKPAWDGLVDAGVLVGDDASVFKVTDAEVRVLGDGPDYWRVNYACVIVNLRSVLGVNA